MSFLPATSAASLTYWLEWQWTVLDHCRSGPPSSAVVFSTLDPRSTESKPGNFTADPQADSKGEVWPELYTLALVENELTQFPYSNCGNLIAGLGSNRFCCTASLDMGPHGSRRVQSGIDLVLPSNNISDAQFAHFSPPEANDQTFCYLQTREASVFGFDSVLYLNDESCTHPLTNPARCLANNTLLLYSQPGCNGTIEQYDLTSTSETFNSSLAGGTISGRTITLGPGIGRVGWTQQIPQKFQVPTQRSAVELTGFLAFVLSLIGHTASCGFVAWKWWRNRTSMNGVLLASQLAWVCNLAGTIAYFYTRFGSNLALYWTLLIVNFTFSAATVLTISYSIQSISTLTELETKHRLLIYASLVVAHLGLFGGKLATPVCYLAPTCTRSSAALQLCLNWGGILGGFWILFMFCIDLWSLNFIAYKITKGTRRTSVWESCKRVARLDRYFSVLVAVQSTVILFYYTAVCLQRYTSLLENDFADISWNGVTNFFISCHSILCFVMVFRLQVVLQLRQKSRKVEVLSPKENEDEVWPSSGTTEPYYNTTSLVGEHRFDIISRIGSQHFNEHVKYKPSKIMLDNSPRVSMSSFDLTASDK